CYGEQRRKYNRFLHLSGSRFSLFLFLTLPRVVPNVWHFPYFMGETSTNSLMIKLQPKIYDHIMLTVRISFIPSVCSQVPVIVIRLLEPRGLSVETSTNNRRFLMVFTTVGTIASITDQKDTKFSFRCFNCGIGRRSDEEAKLSTKQSFSPFRRKTDSARRYFDSKGNRRFPTFSAFRNRNHLSFRLLHP
ncbi:putative tatC-like protein ymf16, partial [Sesamum alatum]